MPRSRTGPRNPSLRAARAVTSAATSHVATRPARVTGWASRPPSAGERASATSSRVRSARASGSSSAPVPASPTASAVARSAGHAQVARATSASPATKWARLRASTTISAGRPRTTRAVQARTAETTYAVSTTGMDQPVSRVASTWSSAPCGSPSTSPAAARASTSGPDAAQGAVPVTAPASRARTTTPSSARRLNRVATGRQEDLPCVPSLPSRAMPVPSVLGPPSWQT